MRIGIDARFYGSIGKGLGRYTQKLIENLERIDNVNQYFIFLRKENFDEYQPKNKNFIKVSANYRWYTFSEQINMSRTLNKYNLDLAHFPHFNVPLLYRRNFVITIHDLILLHFPTVRVTTLNPLFYTLKFLAYKVAIKSALSRAKKIIAVSRFTKNDILANYSVPAEKIEVTYEAADLSPHQFKKMTDNIVSSKNHLSGPVNTEISPKNWCGDKYGIIKPYILYVGNAYPHKNLERLILAFEKLNVLKKGLRLVLVGKEDFFYKRLKKLAGDKKIKNIVFAGFVPDKELDEIYRSAGLYVFPSLYEGFGLPPLEAMAKGVPVASSDHPCMREILGESAYYFDAKAPDEITDAVIKVIEDKILQKQLIQKGYEQVRKYSWRKMAEETLEIYHNSKFPKTYGFTNIERL